MRRIFLIIALATAGRMIGQTYLAEGMKSVLEQNKDLSGCNYAAYGTVHDYLVGRGMTKLSAAPAGYEPFFVTTYARHGSRWLGSANQYDAPTKVLEQAEAKGALTEEGKQLLKDLRSFRSTYCPNNMFGQLTDIGKAQHIGIARRMCSNFPEVFNATAHIYAQSSEVRRCVESMHAEVSVIDSVTGLSIPQEYGKPGMQQRMAGHYHTDAMKQSVAKSYPFHSKETNSMIPYQSVSKRLFTDTSWTTSKDLIKFTDKLFDVICSVHNVTNDIDLWNYLTSDEVNAIWEVKNRLWLRMHGNSETSDCMGPKYAKYTMQDILDDADTIVHRRDWHGASLRFGHDLTLAPLACLMGLGTTADTITEARIDSVNKVWRIQEISPMGANIQLVFYRPTKGKGDILVKALLNEVEVTLPTTPVTGCYYRWDDVKRVFTQSL